MAICPKCHTESDAVLDPCPTGDGYFCIDEDEYYAHSDDRLLGREIDGRYVVQAVLGRGSMSRVYKAHQAQVDRAVALKIFRHETLLGHQESKQTTAEEQRKAEERFEREAKVLGKLSHPNCVTVYDFGVDERDGLLYMAMEYVGGVSLRTAVRRGLKLGAIVEIARQVFEALREAHSLDIVHRDLKPENILLTFRYSSDEQVVKVLDFGIAKLLRGDTQRREKNELFGTPAYMSPEQCEGDGSLVGPHSDVYAFGCVLYEMVCGRLPYEADSPRAMVEQHVEGEVPEVVPKAGLELPDGFADFIRRCLRKEPNERFQTAHEAYVALEEIVTVSDTAFGSSIDVGAGVDASRGSSDPTRDVTVPTNALSGAQLDPLGEEEGEPSEAPLSAPEQKSEQSPEQRPRPTGDRETPAAGADDPRAADLHRETELGSESVVETAQGSEPVSGSRDTAVGAPGDSWWERARFWIRDADAWKLSVLGAVVVVSLISLLLLYLIVTSVAQA